MAKVAVTSRLQFAKLYQNNGILFWGDRRSIDITPRSDDRFHTVVFDDRVDLLAYKYLGDANLWWVIGDYNGLSFCQELEVGSSLRIPSKSVVQMEIVNG